MIRRHQMLKKVFVQVVQESGFLHPAFMNWSEKSIDEALLKYSFITVGESPVGFVCYQETEDRIEILALGVLEEKQRQGVATELMSRLLTQCSDSVLSLSLEVHIKNKKAFAFYSGFGFKTVRIRKNYYSDGGDALVMDLLLSD